MGAEAVYDYLNTSMDLDQLALQLREEMQSTSDVKRKKATKRLRVVEALRKSGNKPQWMIFSALPVIPPTCGRWSSSTAAASRRRPQRPLPPRDQPEQPAEAALELGAPTSSSATRSGCCRRRSTR
jgi:hypothetical protein